MVLTSLPLSLGWVSCPCAHRTVSMHVCVGTDAPGHHARFIPGSLGLEAEMFSFSFEIHPAR